MFRRCIHQGLKVAGLLAIAVALVVIPAVAGGAATSASEQHCVVNVVGHMATGEFVLSPTRCYDTLADAQADGSSYGTSPTRTQSVTTTSGSTWLATHYDGFGWTGSSLSVYGDTCNGWLNMTPTWNNKISSTDSICGVWHFDGFNLAGAVEFITAPGGDLSALNNRTSSIQYT